jgi:primosomal protein N' (replication factor Y)
MTRETIHSSNDDSTGGFCEVALARPFLQQLTYRVPADAWQAASPGARVLVPLGGKRAIGFVAALKRDSELKNVRSIIELLDPEPLFPPALLDVARWVAEYYVAPLGMVLRAALPPSLTTLRGKAGRDTAREPALRRQVIRVVRELPTLSERESLFGRATRQREAYEVLESLGGETTVSHLATQLGFSRAVLQGLVDKGLAERTTQIVSRDPFAQMGPVDSSGPRLTPTTDQAAVIRRLLEQASDDQPGVALLRGVTGSGKTLVYLELLERVVTEQGRSALVLVPEISLTPQTVSRFRARFGDLVAVLHSGLSAGERYDEWRALRDGTKRVVIGARSAVFAPVPDPGLIILDEEHEGSYKQADTPRYHARSVAAMRARLEGCLCLLGSATPALESWANVQAGKYRLYELLARVTGHTLPRVELVDLTQAREEEREAAESSATEPSPGPLIFTRRLRKSILARLERNEQVILLLNRRGYATFVQCDGCGKVWSCRQCNVSLTYHRRRRRIVCHHCAYEADPPLRCDECSSTELTYTGLGTEQVERGLGELFPQARLARMDLDTTGTKWAHFQILERFRQREVDILLGTQMIAKGLDFPHVTLVGVINADVSLNLPDFRASERTFQLLSQVAGRSGRGAEAGEVVVQTSRPSHFALQAAARHDYLAFADRELEDRLEPGYPPHRRLANVVVSGLNEEAVAEATERVADWARSLFEQANIRDAEILGPAPCPIDRLRNRWRWHFLVKADRPAVLGFALREMATHHGQLGGRLRLEIDRDPEALM